MVPISFEFYPPKTEEQRSQLDRTAARLRDHAPDYVSVTFGAGGSTLSHTPESIQRLRGQHGYDGDHFHIEVAAYPEMHPQARDSRADLEHFVRKVRAGANGAITQYFYNADAYFRFVDDIRAAGVEIPVVPGIMPISNFSQIRRFSDMCGAEIPRWIAQRMQSYGDDSTSVREFGAEVVAQLCRRLVDGGAPALHFYTLNLAKPTLNVLSRLG